MASMTHYDGYVARRKRRADMLAAGTIVDPGMLRVAIVESYGGHCGKKSARHSRKDLRHEAEEAVKAVRKSQRERDAAARARAEAEFKSGAST